MDKGDNPAEMKNSVLGENPTGIKHIWTKGDNLAGTKIRMVKERPP